MTTLAESAPEQAYRHVHESKVVRNAIGIPFKTRLHEVWLRRDVLRILAERTLRQKYSNSVLGYAWSLIEPAMLIATYYMLVIIFHRSTPNFPLFIAATLLPWQWFTGTANATVSSLRSNSRLITSISLPREIYPLADVAARTLEYLLSLPIVVVVAWLYGIRPSPFLIAMPLAFVLELMICVGIALLLSSLNTVLRDVQRGIGIVLRVMFYLVPALYPLMNIGPAMRRFYILNPMVGILELNRAVWLPAYWTNWQPVYYSAIGATIVLVAGIATFVRLEHVVLKEL